MSRFIDDLNMVAKAIPQPIGFRATHPAPAKLRIRLVASLTQTGDTTNLADCIDGADAVVFRLADSTQAAKTVLNIVSSLPDIPWGIWLEDAGIRKMEKLTEAGCDFAIVPADSPVSGTLQDNNTGKILEVASSVSDGLMRAVNDLPVDAVLNADAYQTGKSLAWLHLIQFQRMANMLTKPLLVTAPLRLATGELKALWEAGVDGVIVGVDSGQPEALRDLCRIVSELPPRSLHRQRKTEALLPRISIDETGTSKTEEEEEEEE